MLSDAVADQDKIRRERLSNAGDFSMAVENDQRIIEETQTKLDGTDEIPAITDEEEIEEALREIAGLRERIRRANLVEAAEMDIFNRADQHLTTTIESLEAKITDLDMRIADNRERLEEILNLDSWSDLCRYNGYETIDNPDWTLQECEERLRADLKAQQDLAASLTTENDRLVALRTAYNSFVCSFKLHLEKVVDDFEKEMADAAASEGEIPLPENPELELENRIREGIRTGTLEGVPLDLSTFTGLSVRDTSSREAYIVVFNSLLRDEAAKAVDDLSSFIDARFNEVIRLSNAETRSLSASSDEAIQKIDEINLYIDGHHPLSEYIKDNPDFSCYDGAKIIVTRTDGGGDFPPGTNDASEAGLLFARRVSGLAGVETYVHDTEADKFITEAEAVARSEEMITVGDLGIARGAHSHPDADGSPKYWMPFSTHANYTSAVEGYVQAVNQAREAEYAKQVDEGTAPMIKSWKIRALSGTQALCVAECIECSNDDIISDRIAELEKIIKDGTKSVRRFRSENIPPCDESDTQLESLCNSIELKKDQLYETTFEANKNYAEANRLITAIVSEEAQLEAKNCCCVPNEKRISELTDKKDELSSERERIEERAADAVVNEQVAVDWTTSLAMLDRILLIIQEELDAVNDCDNSGKSETIIYTDTTLSDEAIEAQRELDQLAKVCDDCGVWRIIRAGTDNTFEANEGPECLIGWMYEDNGDLLIDETMPANGAKFISIAYKPEDILIDKRGDVYADGEKIARVAISGLVGYDFHGFYNDQLSQLMINPRYIGDNRIFHVMQQGFHVTCESVNSLRDELVRHDMIPYHIGTWFEAREPECLPEHAEAKDPCEIKCCNIPELPDCVEIKEEGCAVVVPEWFKDWYSKHKEYLYIKLPYDPRVHGDPARYSKEEQQKFAAALIDLVISYFASTPFNITSGFKEWENMERILNILPVIKRPGYSRSKFKFADWVIGANKNSPKISFPVEIDSSTGQPVDCVDCCEDLIDSSCVIETEEFDCCEMACGRWRQDCSYEKGQIVISKDGTACYRAVIDVCSGDCNPKPGTHAAIGIWEDCEPDCETKAPSCEFEISTNYLDASESCNSKVTVGAKYPLTDNVCEYKWVLSAVNSAGRYSSDLSVESFGVAPGEKLNETSNIITIDIPVLQEDCDVSDTPNKWIFTLSAYGLESDELIRSCSSQEIELSVSCGFSINVWDGVEALKAEAYNWCSEQSSENPQGQLRTAPNSDIKDLQDDVYNTFLNARSTAFEIERKYSEFESQLRQNNLIDRGYVEGAMLLAPFMTRFIILRDSLNVYKSAVYTMASQSEDPAVLEEIERLNAVFEMDRDYLDRPVQNWQNFVAAVEANPNIDVLDEARAAGATGRQALASLALSDTTPAKRQLDAVAKMIETAGLYTGTENCCCIIVKPEGENKACDLSWVWVVSSGNQEIPYYAGLGLQPVESVLCAERNPDVTGNTDVTVTLRGYASSCDELVKSRIDNWGAFGSAASWAEQSDGFTALPVCSCDNALYITCPCSPITGLVSVEMRPCVNQFSDDLLREFISTETVVFLDHLNDFNFDCDVDWYWQITNQTTGEVEEHKTEASKEAESREVHLTSEETVYKIVLRWQGEFTGGVAHEQFVTTPICGELDLTFNASFTDTDYGDISINTVDTNEGDSYKPEIYDGEVLESNFIQTRSRWTISEADSADSPKNKLWINVGDTNPYGEFKITATHTPDESDPKWQAININLYKFQWTVKAVLTPPSDGVEGVYLEVYSSNRFYAVDNKIPDLETDLINAKNFNEMDNNNLYDYVVELKAYDMSNAEMLQQSQLIENSTHKGYRELKEIVTTGWIGVAEPHHFTLALNSGDEENPNLAREISYRPPLNYSNTVESANKPISRFQANFVYGNEETENVTHDIEFIVTNDPCVTTDKTMTVPVMTNDIAAVQELLDSGERLITLNYTATAEWTLSDECGDLPPNDHTNISFGIRLGQNMGVEPTPIESTNNAEGTRESDTISANFSFDYEWDLSGISDVRPVFTTAPENLGIGFNLFLDATDNSLVPSDLDSTAMGVQNVIKNPFSICSDRTTIVMGEPEDCPDLCCIKLDAPEIVGGEYSEMKFNEQGILELSAINPPPVITLPEGCDDDTNLELTSYKVYINGEHNGQFFTK